jgi:hypothetical protein
MKLLILDPRKGDSKADLFVLDEKDLQLNKIEFEYVPEFHYNKSNHQIAVVETELRKTEHDKTRHWLKSFSADSFELLLKKETPERPMYSGFPGRSTRVKSSNSGRYLYFLESSINPDKIDVYRLLVHRYDYKTDKIESSPIKIDSCMIDFDQFGVNDDELCFHLSCEFPSVIAFGKFNSPKLNFIQLEETPSRQHSLQETCGSWFSKEKNALYCITGEGAIYEVHSNPPASKLITYLPLKAENYIPLQQIYENGEDLLVGISVNIEERGMSLASQIWRISIDNGEVLDKIELPFPIMNFITTPDKYLIIGVSPYEKAIILVEANTGKVLGMKNEIGISPAEVFAIP